MELLRLLPVTSSPISTKDEVKFQWLALAWRRLVRGSVAWVGVDVKCLTFSRSHNLLTGFRILKALMISDGFDNLGIVTWNGCLLTNYYRELLPLSPVRSLVSLSSPSLYIYLFSLSVFYSSFLPPLPLIRFGFLLLVRSRFHPNVINFKQCTHRQV